MATKTIFRIRMALYVLIILLAVLLDDAAFGAVQPKYVPFVTPLAVCAVGLWEGGEKGTIFGLVGGCLLAWSNELTYYGAWCLLVLPACGLAAGVMTEYYLQKGIKTMLTMGAVSLLLTDGMRCLVGGLRGTMPGDAFIQYFIPEALISMLFCLLFYPLTRVVSRIGGSHG